MMRKGTGGPQPRASAAGTPACGRASRSAASTPTQTRAAHTPTRPQAWTPGASSSSPAFQPRAAAVTPAAHAPAQQPRTVTAVDTAVPASPAHVQLQLLTQATPGLSPAAAAGAQQPAVAAAQLPVRAPPANTQITPAQQGAAGGGSPDAPAHSSSPHPDRLRRMQHLPQQFVAIMTEVSHPRQSFFDDVLLPRATDWLCNRKPALREKVRHMNVAFTYCDRLLELSAASAQHGLGRRKGRATHLQNRREEERKIQISVCLVGIREQSWQHGK